MPRTVKLFLVLCLVYTASLVWWNFGPLLFPDPHRLQNLAQLPSDTRAMVDQADWMAAAMRTVIPLAFVLTFAFMAAFGRRNWARWALAVILVLTEVVALSLIALLAYRAAQFVPGASFVSVMFEQWLSRWAHWQAWAWLALKLAMIVTIFGPGAKSWFRRGISPA